jgi:hypothetical protein
MKLLKKLLLRIVLLIIIACTAIGSLAIYKSFTAIDELMMQKVDDQLTLRTALIEEKLDSTVRMIEMYAHDENVISALENDDYSSDVINMFT